MLADDLIASNDLKSLGWGYGQLVHDLRKAHRFDLDRDFVAAADELAQMRPAAFVKSLPLCRLPFEVCWIETTQNYRPRYQGGRPIRRVGILIREEPSTRIWLAHLAWSFTDGGMGLSSVAVGLDPQSSTAPFSQAGSSLFRQNALKGKDLDPNDLVKLGHKSNDENVAAAEIIVNICSPVPAVYWKDRYKAAQQRSGKQGIFEIMEPGQDDWSAEPIFWLAVVALINSRNASVTVPGPDLGRLNRARARRDQTELLTYSTCKIAPKLKRRIDAERHQEGEPVRAHFVRGHFKIRSSGVFWWSPFLRGDKRLGFADKDYRVTGGRA